MDRIYPSLSISDQGLQAKSLWSVLAYLMIFSAVAVFIVAWFSGAIGFSLPHPSFWLLLMVSGMLLGSVLLSLTLYFPVTQKAQQVGVYKQRWTQGRWVTWILALLLSGLYVCIYWFPAYIGFANGINGENTGLVALFDGLKQFFSGNTQDRANQWFAYGSLYTLIVLSLGIKFMLKYRKSRYQRKRTLVLILAQLIFAYLIPEILAGLNYNDISNDAGSHLGWYDSDLKNTWPLDYDFFYEGHLDAMQQPEYQPIGMLYLLWGILMFTVVTPVLTYFYGKRWYCSWICGCGALAETAGDAFRQLSSKKLVAWKIERWMVHGVLLLVIAMTFATLYAHFSHQSEIFGLNVYQYFQRPYGFFIGAIFSGVIGVGFYPLMGNRVWCRFGCPMAAYMGIVQRFKSRFRITTTGGSCISCGQCSVYCEMGIDVRSYAQKGEEIKRAACVGCGICASVCPRGVLKLENK